LKYGSEAWILRESVIERLEAPQMRFLRPLLVVIRLNDKGNRKEINYLKHYQWK
jgi:hypothetical protein